MGRAASGCSQPNPTLSHQQPQQHGASRDGMRKRKIPFNPQGPAAGLDPAGHGAVGAVCCPGKCSWGGIPQDAAALHHQAVHYRERRGDLLKLWMRRVIHLLHCSAGLCVCFLSFPRTWNSSLDFMPPLHCCLQWLGFSQHAFSRARVLGTIYF